MNTEQERADFEAWAVRERIAYRDEKHGLCFYNGQRHSYWFGYQAGRAALQSHAGDTTAASVQRPVGYVSRDFLDGKWTLDHIAKSDEGQISRTIPVFAKPPQPAPDVTRLVEALTELCDEIDKHEIHAAISTTNISWFKRKAREALAALQSQKPEPNDLMLSGVIRMPFEMAMASEISRLQFYQRAQQALNELEALQSQDRDGARLDWLQQHDERFYNLLRITSIVNKGFSPTNSSGKRWFSSIREAIDHARRVEGDGHTAMEKMT